MKEHFKKELVVTKVRDNFHIVGKYKDSAKKRL